MTNSTPNSLLPNALLPEKPLLLHPSLATAIGVEEALFMVGLRDRVAYTTAHQSRGFAWYQLRTADVCAVFPFWNKQALQRISTSARDKGVLVFTAPITETADNFRFAFNEKVQQQLTTQHTNTTHTTPAHSAATIATQPVTTPQQNTYDGHFLSKKSIAPNWQPDQVTLDQLAQHGITQEFAYECLPQFITYWHQRGDKRHSWGSTFLKSVLQQWRDFEGQHSIASNWQPDKFTLDQLAQYGITKEFAYECLPQFITYWHQSGDKRRSWDSAFIKNVLQQRQDLKKQQQRKSQETTITSDWQPSLDAMEILTQQAGINRQFVEDAVPEFVLYWQERGETHRTWNTKFIQHIRIQWAKYTNAIEHNADPHPIPPQWQPSEDVFDVLRLANIDVTYAKSLIPEFVLYWRDRGLLYGSWNTKYLQHVKHVWARRLPETQADGTINRQLREISLEEQLTDRSWAE